MDKRLCTFFFLFASSCWSTIIACDECMYNDSFVVCSDYLLSRSIYEKTILQLSIHQDFNRADTQNLNHGVCATDSAVSFEDLEHDHSFEKNFITKCINCSRAAVHSYYTGRSGRSFINSYMSVVFSLILAGIAFLCLATALDLKMSSGRFNGLIFYAASIHLNQDIFIQTKGIQYLLFSFFNLDFSFSICFYDELSSAKKLWLQLAFPLCIVLLVLIIAIAFQYSTVLYNLSVATVPISSILLVLAYMKVLRTTVSILPFKTISGVGIVWIYDERVQYFESNHLLLVMLSVIFLVFIVPPCTLILIAPQYSYHIATDYIEESKLGLTLSSIIDMYTGRFKQHTRFWFGLILLVYTFQVFIHHFTGGNGLTNLVATIISSCVLLYANLLLDGVYAKGYVICNKLEHFLFLNLIAVSSLIILRHSGNHSLPDICVYILIFPAVLIIGNSPLEHKVFPKLKPYFGYFKKSSETNTKELSSTLDLVNNQNLNHTGNSYEEDVSKNTEQRRESLIFYVSSSDSSQSTTGSIPAINNHKRKGIVTSSELYIDKNCDCNEAELIPVEISLQQTVEKDSEGVDTHIIQYSHISSHIPSAIVSNSSNSSNKVHFEQHVSPACEFSRSHNSSESCSNSQSSTVSSLKNTLKAINSSLVPQKQSMNKKYRPLKYSPIQRRHSLNYQKRINTNNRRNSLRSTKQLKSQIHNKGSAKMLSTLLPSMPISTPVVEVTSTGKTLSHGGIVINIPPGAVDAKVKFYLEIGLIIPHGLFEFPTDYGSVSPILWIYCSNFVQFKKRVKIILPHCLSKVTTVGNDSLGLCFMKATESNGSIINFRPISFSDNMFSFAENRGVLETINLNAFFCIAAKHSSSLLVKKAEFCLTRIEPQQWSSDTTIFFCISYLLNSCLEDIKKQFPAEKFKIVSQQHFQFQDITDPSIGIAVNCLTSDWLLTVENNTIITAKEVHLSNDLHHPLHQLTRECGLYPPRFQLRVCKSGVGMSPPSTACVSFSGTKQSLNYAISLPLHPAASTGNLLSEARSKSSRSKGRAKSCLGLTPSSSFYQLVKDIEDLKELEYSPYWEDLELRVVYKVATKWREIGTLLIDQHALAEIDEDYKDCRKKMRAVLRTWKEGEGEYLPYYWSSLVVVLRTDVVGETNLATHLMEDYCIEISYT